ncbi:MAG: hypothetical protein L0J84_11815 [Brachybacterium sp.]|nr:hypothetical protein [Brachybacterium sp.]
MPIPFLGGDKWESFIEWAGPSRLIGWADPSDLEGLAFAEKLRQIRIWARAGVSAYLRYTPLDTITNALTWQLLRVPKARRGPATADDRELLERARSFHAEIGGSPMPDHGQAARAIKHAQIWPDDIPTQVRGDMADAAFAYAGMLRDTVKDTGDWYEANDAGHAYWLGTVLSQTGNPYRLGTVLRRARKRILGWPSRFIDAREEHFLNNALLSVDDDRMRILCPWRMPRWLIRATKGCFVMWPEAGSPQICRFWDYIDWPALLKEHSNQLTISDVDWPSTATLEIVEDARSHGYTAYADVFLWFSGFTLAGKPKFQIDCVGMQIDKTLPVDQADRYVRQLRTAYRAKGSQGILDYECEGLYVNNLEKSDVPLQALLDEAAARDQCRSKPSKEHSWIFC